MALARSKGPWRLKKRPSPFNALPFLKLEFLGALSATRAGWVSRDLPRGRASKDRLERFEGVSVHYAATQAEAQPFEGEEVAVVEQGGVVDHRRDRAPLCGSSATAKPKNCEGIIHFEDEPSALL